MITTYDWILGTAELAAAFLSIIAGIIAISMIEASRQQKILGAWKWMIVGLVLFMVEEIFGALKSFGIYSTPHITHIIPFFILLFVIAALISQINITKGVD